ncbi:kinesin-related protein 11-like [Trifolium medium]|uniref:Kinesin-related protein 11-like n=1 Tax=Trifolium medium TaxID=97028 RepID=A0A392NUH4_9FABA|nr:kinesin-related protein 11-like [Trifolium medium]
MASSSRARSSSPFSHRKPSTPYSSTSSSSSLTNGRIIPRSSSSATSSFFNPGGRSTTPSRGRSESTFYGSRGYRDRSPVAFGAEELIVDPVDTSTSADSISVTIRFRPLSEREYNKGDEIAWYADGDKIVRNEYNPATAYAFDEVYEVAAKPVVKAAMEGVNGMKC